MTEHLGFMATKVDKVHHQCQLIIFVIVSTMSNIVGRAAGVYCQHLEQMSHQSSVMRSHVSLAVGRSGPPMMILNMMEAKVGKP